jgi:copper chaperone CopZ
MKWVIGAVVLAFFFLLGLRLLRPLTVRQATIHMAHLKTKDEAIEVTRILQGLRGVLEVSVDLEQHFARITYRKGKVTVEEMLQALHADGF